MSPFVTEVALYRLLIRPHRFLAAYTWMFYWSRVLLLIAIFIRLRPEYTRENLNIVRPDDLGFYSCREIYDKNNYDFAIEKICSPKFEIIQNGRALYRLLIRPHRFLAAYTWMFYWSRVVVDIPAQ
jgi:hypothetical protein